MRRLIYFLPIAGFLALMAYFIAVLQRDPAVLPSALIDQPAPDFTLAGLGGQPGFARADLAGQVVVINFFASWCVPCRAEHPLLMRLGGELGVPVYGIDFKDPPEAAMQFIAALGNPYRGIGVDREGRTGIDFGLYGVPETYVIDKAGRVRLRHVGPLTAEDVKREILPAVRALGR